MVIDGYQRLFMVITVYLNSAMVILVGGYHWLSVVNNGIENNFIDFKIMVMVICGHYCVSQHCNGYLGYWWLPVVICGY